LGAIAALIRLAGLYRPATQAPPEKVEPDELLVLLQADRARASIAAVATGVARRATG